MFRSLFVWVLLMAIAASLDEPAVAIVAFAAFLVGKYATRAVVEPEP